MAVGNVGIFWSTHPTISFPVWVDDPGGQCETRVVDKTRHVAPVTPLDLQFPHNTVVPESSRCRRILQQSLFTQINLV